MYTNRTEQKQNKYRIETTEIEQKQNRYRTINESRLKCVFIRYTGIDTQQKQNKKQNRNRTYTER